MPIDVTRVKAICFDVDGTLSDTDDQFVQKLVRWMKPTRILFGRHNLQKIARRMVMFTEGPGNWAYSLADRMGLDSKIVAVGDRLYEMGIGNSTQPFLLIDGVMDMLESLRNHYPLSIISVRGQKSTNRFLQQFDLSSYFVAVATGQTCVHTKPYPDPLEWAAKKMGVPSSTCLMVGDTVMDIFTGKKAGAQTVGVLCGFGDKNELERAGADLILENTVELASYLLDINSF